MKKIWMKFSVLAFVVAMLAPASLQAQNDKDKEAKELKEDKEKKEKKEKRESDQIIITRNANDNQKVVVEINGDNITVNGKPLADFKDGDISVSHNKMRNFYEMKDGESFSYNGYDGYAAPNGKGYLTINDDRAMLGVTTEKAEQGVEINSVTKESAAEKAGLKEGDVITKIDDSKIEDPDDLSKAVQKHKVGEKVNITYLRDKKTQTVSAELTKWKGVSIFTTGKNNFKMDMAMPRMEAFPKTRMNGLNMNGQSWSWSSGGPKLGLSVQDTDDGKGVKVIEVDDESTSNKAGVKEDDVITEVDGKAVNSTDDITKIIRESKEKASISLKLLRGGKTQTIEVKMPRKIKTADL